MTDPSAGLPDPVAAYIREVAPSVAAAGVERVAPLTGDASARSYYRVSFEGTSRVGASAILMVMPAGAGPLGSEEASEGENPITEMPFLNVARHLARAGVNVPAIFDARPEQGLVLLEDLGDTHLYDVVSNESQRLKGLQFFGLAVDQMSRMHEAASRPVAGDDCVAFHQRMSERLILWEFEHFIEYGYEARVGRKLSDEEGRGVRELFATISRELAEQPAVFTHRDFHSRNILVSEGSIVLIDFQDALMGPAVYDLASLLRDRYFGLSDDEIVALIQRYLLARPQSREARMPFEAFRRLFDLQVLQRNMKAAGRFVYLDRVKGKPHLLKHIPALFASMRETIERHPEELGVLEPLVSQAARVRS